MADYDQGGSFRQLQRVALGPSVGFTYGPTFDAGVLSVTAAGVTVVPAGTTLVRVNIAGSVTLQLPRAKGNAAGAIAVPGTWIQSLLTITDVGGNAGSFPITVQPNAGDTIGGLSGLIINTAYGLVNLLQDTQAGNWIYSTAGAIAAGLSDAPSDGNTYARNNGSWVNAGLIPENVQSANYTTVLTDAGKFIYHPASDANARTFTIAANASVAYALGSPISFVNLSANALTIAIASDTMYLAGTGTTGSRTLAQYGVATALKTDATTWIISGTGLT